PRRAEERRHDEQFSEHDSFYPPGRARSGRGAAGTIPQVRRFRTLALSLAAIAAAVACRREAPPAAADRFAGAPIVLISIDTLRADHLPAYGYRSGSTPAIDRLAGTGIVFDEVYSQVPLTLPSHASLFTGRLPL